MQVFSITNTKIDSPPHSHNAVYYFKDSTIEPVRYESSFSIRYLVKGNVKTCINGRINTLRPGYVLIVKPGSIVNSESVGEISGVSIFLEPEMYERLGDGCLSDRSVKNLYEQLMCEVNLFSNVLLRNLIDCLDGMMLDGSPSVVTSQVTTSLQIDIARIISQMSQMNRKKITTRIDLLDRLEKARLQMENDIAQKFSLSQLANCSSMSKFAFLRNFKEAFHQTPNQYLINLKIEAAKVFLQEGLKVKDTALRCGYPDIFSFSKQFKAVTGSAPNCVREHAPHSQNSMKPLFLVQ